MFGKAKVWHSGLSKAGKGIVWTLAGVFGVAAVSAAANPAPQPPEAKPTAQVQTEEKEPVIETRTVTETEAVAFTSTTVEDGNLAKGSTAVRTNGVNGVKTMTYDIDYTNGVAGEKKLVKEEVTTAPIAQVTAIGTYVKPAAAPKPASNCDPNYTPCVPNVSYDLDCPDIGFRVTVIGSDRHGFDGNDNDGLGCESY